METHLKVIFQTMHIVAQQHFHSERIQLCTNERAAMSNVGDNQFQILALSK